MSKQLKKSETAEMQAIEKVNPNQGKNSLIAAFGADPKKTEKHPVVRNVDYIPISFIESELDSYFGPLSWDVPDFEITPLGDGCFMAMVKVRVMHPVEKRWLTYTGTSSKKFSPKQINGFAGTMKSLAVKNALAPIGNVFGRNLNRNQVENENMKEATREFLSETDIMERISQAASLGELNEIRNGLPPQLRNNIAIKTALNEQFKSLPNV